jgi:hypothetical protein
MREDLGGTQSDYQIKNEDFPYMSGALGGPKGAFEVFHPEDIIA